MKKILIALIACMFVISMLSGITVEEKEEFELKARKYIETRDKVPVYTEYGIDTLPVEKGKPTKGPGGGGNRRRRK